MRDGSFDLDPASRADPSKSQEHQHSIGANVSEGLRLEANRATPRLCIEEVAEGGEAHDGTVGVGSSEIDLNGGIDKAAGDCGANRFLIETSPKAS